MTLTIENTVIKINEDWCKKCGICIAFCPKNVLSSDALGRVQIANPDLCIACKICERLCPDYAINIEGDKDE